MLLDGRQLQDASVPDSKLESGGGGSGEAYQRDVNQVGHGLSVQDVIYHDGSSWAKAKADDTATLGIALVSAVADVDNFTATFGGYVSGLSGLTAGNYYFVSAGSAGAITSTEPTSGYSNPILYALSSSEGIVLPFRASTAGSTGLDDLSDVSLGTPVAGHVLAYDGSAWIEAGGLTLVEAKEITGSAVSSVTFSGLDGDADLRYLIVARIVGAGVVGEWLAVEPNGVTTNQNTQSGVISSGSFSGSDLGRMRVGQVPSGTEAQVTALLQAETGGNRTCWASCTNNSGSKAQNRWLGSVWTDTATNITSIDFVTVGGNAEMGVGSRILLYKLAA